MDRQKLAKANELIKEIDKYMEVKNFISTKPSFNAQTDSRIDNIRLKSNNNEYLDFKIDKKLSDIILLVVDSLIKKELRS